MIIQDPIYGQFAVTHPIALELIAAPSFQRLKKIAQFGLPNEYYHLSGYSRYQHSLGVYHLLQMFQASEAEQLAGLLHDISHTAFSHLVDWVVGDSLQENYQDNRHLEVLQQPDISSILNKYGYTSEEMANYSQFGLLEQDMPLLCADRLDYALREGSLRLTQQVLADLVVVDQKLAFTSTTTAYRFTAHFLRQQEHHWAGYEAATRYQIFSTLLKEALQSGIITELDFFETDQHVIDILKRSAILHFGEVLNILTLKDLSHLEKSATPTFKKLRYVDPLVKTSTELLPLSHLNTTFAEELTAFKKRLQKGVFTGLASTMQKIT